MPDILHRIGIRSSSIEEVYQGLTTIEGLCGWWAANTTGEAGLVDGLVEFRFEGGEIDIRVVALDPFNSVVWEVLKGPHEWIGTRISWQLKKEEEYAIVLFSHLGWDEAVEMMHHCSTKWAIFLMSFKSLIETGKGLPDPYDVKIDNWN